MEKLKFNPDNAKYYSEEFIKGFECGVERQFNADMAEKTAEWTYREEFFDDEETPRMAWGCTNCGRSIKNVHEKSNYCPNCGRRMNGGAE